VSLTADPKDVDFAGAESATLGIRNSGRGSAMLKRGNTGRLDKVASDLISSSTRKSQSSWREKFVLDRLISDFRCLDCGHVAAAVRFLCQIAILYSLVVTPVLVCMSGSPSIAESFVEVLCEVLLVLSIASPFLFGIENPEMKNEIIRSYRKVLNIYGRGFLVLDIIASCPWHLIWLILGGGSSLSWARTFSLCRLLRLHGFMVGGHHTDMDLFHLSSMLSLHPNLLRAVRLIVFFFFVVHLTACGYYAVASDNSSAWARYATDGSTFSEWIHAYYWALCAIMGENMGPDEDSETAYNSAVVAGGVLLNSCIVGSMASMLGSLDESAARRKSKLDTIDTFMQRNGVTKELFEQVQQYYKYLYSSVSRDAGMLQDLSPSLRLKIDLCIHKRFISNCHMFSTCSVECVATLVTIISRNWVIFTPSELVFSMGEEGDAMYFVVKGEIVLYSPGRKVDDEFDDHIDVKDVQRIRNGERVPCGKLLATCTQGGFFGELALVIEGSVRAASAAAYTFSELLNLPACDFNSVLEIFPDFKGKIQDMCAQRLEQNRKSFLKDKADEDGPTQISSFKSNESTEDPKALKENSTFMGVLPFRRKRGSLK
jgi:CRP-like cAMP-binding protein